MGLGKIARGLGKVGLVIESVGYVFAAGSSLWKAIRRKRLDDRAATPPTAGDTPVT